MAATRTIRISDSDYEFIARRIKTMEARYKRKFTHEAFVSMLIDFVFSCYRDLDVSGIDEDEHIKKNMEYRLRLYWEEYINRCWGIGIEQH